MHALDLTFFGLFTADQAFCVLDHGSQGEIILVLGNILEPFEVLPHFLERATAGWFATDQQHGAMMDRVRSAFNDAAIESVYRSAIASQQVLPLGARCTAVARPSEGSNATTHRFPGDL